MDCSCYSAFQPDPTGNDRGSSQFLIANYADDADNGQPGLTLGTGTTTNEPAFTELWLGRHELTRIKKAETKILTEDPVRFRTKTILRSLRCLLLEKTFSFRNASSTLHTRFAP